MYLRKHYTESVWNFLEIFNWSHTTTTTFHCHMLTHLKYLIKKLYSLHKNQSANFKLEQQCWVYTSIETAWDKMRTRVKGVYLSHLTPSRPISVSSRSSWKHVGKSYLRQRAQMFHLVFEVTVDYTLVQFSNIFF